MTTGNQHDNQPKPATVKEMHEQIQKNMTDARKTPEYAEEKASEPKASQSKGEWTVETIVEIRLRTTGVLGIGALDKAIADAHNTALAAVTASAITQLDQAYAKGAADERNKNL